MAIKNWLPKFAALFGLITLLTPLHAADPIALKWLEATPTANTGINFGVPWPKGALQKSDALTLKDAAKEIPLQSWPLAYWPDGSIKWTGHALSTGTGLAGPLQLSTTTTATPVQNSLTAIDTDTTLNIDTHALRATFAKTGPNLLESITIGDRKVAEKGRLTLQLEDRANQAQGILKTTTCNTRVNKITLENSGPLRAVVKVEGAHTVENRTLLPFTTRFYFYANSTAIRIVHSFIFDGDPEKDFIKGMGLTFSVPMVEELHNRHVRFAGEGTGVWRQPVRLLPGYRNALSAQEYETHLEGQRLPNLAEANNRTAMESVAVYNDMKLTQLGPGSFSIDKRTTDASSWLHVTDGNRSLGLALLGDVSGGIAIGIKDFWQKHPAALEVRNATTSSGELTAWFWSPDAPAMDLRVYDTVPHGLPTSYEDWKPGWGTAHGVAHTTEMTLWGFNAIPSSSDVVNMAKTAAAPPVIVCTPEYYHQLNTFGYWSLPDRSTPTLRWVEDQLDQLYTFYRDQVDERGWYGFWNHGDIMHNYDFGRGDWRYDIGGWAWANTELMPDMFLWYTFLRTGKPDAYRMAEAMTRHTSEVDVHHIGPFAPMGSRHHVNHWGDGAKQPRASHAMLKRYLYYLSGGDERLGDLMREQLDADLAYAKLQQFNGSHYVPGPDGQPRLEQQNSRAAPTPQQLATMPAPPARGARGNIPALTYADGKPMEPRFTNVNFGLDWISYMSNWTTEWERTGDPLWRDRVRAGMQSIVARSNNGPLSQNYFDIIFGGPEILFDAKPMYDYPEFWEGFAKVCEAVSTSGGNQMTAPRGAAYAAFIRKDQTLGSLAWEKLVGTADINANIPQPRKNTGPTVVKPITDPVFLGRGAGWQLHGVASVQWALNAIETTELAKPYLAAWEADRAAGRGAPPARGRGTGRGN